MESNVDYNKIKNDDSNERVEKNNRKEKNKLLKFIKTNLYLNDNNYFIKNTIKMNKFREEKYKNHKNRVKTFQQNNTLPKMLYFNKYINEDKINQFSKKKVTVVNILIH